jgi:hypothetical protein
MSVKKAIATAMQNPGITVKLFGTYPIMLRQNDKTPVIVNDPVFYKDGDCRMEGYQVCNNGLRKQVYWSFS